MKNPSEMTTEEKYAYTEKVMAMICDLLEAEGVPHGFAFASMLIIIEGLVEEGDVPADIAIEGLKSVINDLEDTAPETAH